MTEYGAIKTGKLKLKGNKSLFKADKTRKRKHDDGESSKVNPDVKAHGGWWVMTEEGDLKGGINLAIEVGDNKNCYLAAMDNGKFTLGAPHDEGDEPAPEEIFTLIKTPDDPKISLKTGYGKYIGVNSEGQLVATAEAIGVRERFEVIFQEGKTALQAVSSSCFVSLKPNSEGYVYVSSKTAQEHEMVNVRSNVEKTGPVDWRPSEDKKSAKDCETAYV
uniref:FRG1 n=1 Tax=Plectus sambesii TaxID=2011161 RepID=A0A914WA56_9BILA